MVLPQRDLLDAEPPQAVVDGPQEVLVRAVGAHPPPSVRTWPPFVARKTSVAHAEFVEQAGDESFVLALRPGAAFGTGPVGVGGVEERDPRVDRGPHGVGQLLAGLATGLVEGHQAETDGADLDASDGVVTDVTNLHTASLPDSRRGSTRPTSSYRPSRRPGTILRP